MCSLLCSELLAKWNNLGFATILTIHNKQPQIPVPWWGEENQILKGIKVTDIRNEDLQVESSFDTRKGRPGR